jgi:hypothetical protein
MSVQDALVHLDDALEALTLEAYTCPVRDAGTEDAEWKRSDPIQATLAIELERVDSAIGPRGQSMFYPIAESIKQAVVAIIAAQNSLKETKQ